MGQRTSIVATAPVDSAVTDARAEAYWRRHASELRAAVARDEAAKP